jgi:hypothetical protein
MTTKSSPSGTPAAGRSPMQQFFLARLEHLVDQRGRYSALVAPEDWRQKLIARAIYSSYRDLVDLNLTEEARSILERGRASKN